MRFFTPPAPRIAIAIDAPTPDEAGPGRAYQLMELPANIMVPIWLQPQQAVFATVVPGAGGFGTLGYICEFLDEDQD